MEWFGRYKQNERDACRVSCIAGKSNWKSRLGSINKISCWLCGVLPGYCLFLYSTRKVHKRSFDRCHAGCKVWCLPSLHRKYASLQAFWLTHRISNFPVASPFVDYLKAEEEKQLADKFVRVAQRFLDNEYPPRGIGSSLFSHIYEFGDKIMSDDVRQAFFTKLKDLGAPNVPLQSNTTATVDSSSKSTSGASDQVPQSMEPRQQEDVMMTD